MTMKKIFILVIVCFVGCLACTEERAGYYEGEDNWVQFYYTWPVGNPYISLVYYPYAGYMAMLNSQNTRDTVYFRLHLIGRPSTETRTVKFESYDGELEYDYLEHAVAGEDYVAFDDPEMLPCLEIPGDSAYINIPVILLYNPSKVGKTLQLDFKLIDSPDLVVGDTCLMRARAKFSCL